jgi:hypothetical protein
MATDRPFADARGFRHFLGTPRPDQRFTIYGREPLGSAESTAALRQLMSRLAARMSARFPWPRSKDAGIRDWENPDIPSGYTYLLQLVAHDLVQTSIPMSIVRHPISVPLNGRTHGLMLDTIYGGGPMACPHVYALDGDSSENRTKLRLGRMQRDLLSANLPCPFRDIARGTAEGPAGDPGLTEVMIADSRNDDHPIIAQLTALFHHLHNGIVDLFPAGRDEGKSARHGALMRTLCARAAVTLIYRNVVRTDLMRRILHPVVYDAYWVDAPRFLDPAPPHLGIPVEFTHGAFRFGHAMVRNEYRFNDLSEFELVDTLDRTSSREPRNMPLDNKWIIRWSHFFNINGNPANLSRRIGPELSQGLLYEGRFAEIDETRRVGLLYRDLMSAAYLDLWSVNALIGEIAARRPELVDLSALLRDKDYRAAAIRAWLADERSLSAFTDEDVHSLATDPPLFFFILFEAAHEASGTRLGVLGSIIVAEVIFGALVRAPLPEEIGSAGIREMLSKLCSSAFGANHLATVPDIGSMVELVEATADLAMLRAAEPAFL